jgi:hypothetical protein
MFHLKPMSILLLSYFLVFSTSTTVVDPNYTDLIPNPTISLPNISGDIYYDYQFFPSEPEYLPVCINQQVKKYSSYGHMKKDVLGNETCIPASPNCRPGNQDCCSFYDCLERNCQCGEEGYPLGYGRRYCQLFSNYPFEGRGSEWRDATLRCLQRSLIQFSQCPPTTCQSLHSEAFDSHPYCYTSSGVCLLSPQDLLGILAITYGDILNVEGVTQILETARRCGLRYVLELDLHIISSACTIGNSFRDLLSDLWRRSGILPSWMMSSSIWEFTGVRNENLRRSEENEDWRIKIMLWHKESSLSFEEQRRQLQELGKKLSGMINSHEYRNELDKMFPDTLKSMDVRITNQDLDVNSDGHSLSPYLLPIMLLINFM